LVVSLSFFFSSRRRHTRFSRDWSSDVCSSDLARPLAPAGVQSLIRPLTPTRTSSTQSPLARLIRPPGLALPRKREKVVPLPGKVVARVTSGWSVPLTTWRTWVPATLMAQPPAPLAVQSHPGLGATPTHQAPWFTLTDRF